MNPLLATAAVIALVSTITTDAHAQVGVKAPAMPFRDSPLASPLFGPSVKSIMTGRDWTGTLPSARLANGTRAQIGKIHCPMPVFAPDSTRQDRMPVSRPDTALAEHIPVAKSQCTNPLWNKSHP